MKDIEIDIFRATQHAWDRMNESMHCEDMGAPMPIFTHGFRTGASIPTRSPEDEWDAFNHKEGEPPPDLLVAGIMAGREFYKVLQDRGENSC